MNKTFKRTPKQIQQTAMLAGTAKHNMSYGGSRSGKTFGICRAMVIRAAKTRSRHLAVRLRFNHAKTSLWYETFPKVFDICFPNMPVHQNKSDWFYTLPNGSEIWVGGLDEKERVEKILGKEYSTIFFNECSQIPYTSINIALTRLAELNALRKKVYYDENPPTKRHWSFPLFVLGLDPETWEPRTDSTNYASILMNPRDNLANIDDDYMAGILDQMPERERRRFRDGEFLDDSSGAIYHGFQRAKHVAKVERIHDVPLTFGMDFNVSPFTAVVCQIVNGKLFVLDEFYVNNSHTEQMAGLITEKFGNGWTIIPDATGKALKTSAAGLSDHAILRNHGFVIPRVNNPFRMDRYNAVNKMFEDERIVIDPKCVKLIKDLEQVSFKEGTNLPEEKDLTLTHISDALGYLIHWAFPIVKISSGVHNI